MKVAVTIPFDQALSKNRRRGIGAGRSNNLPRGRKSHVFVKADARAAEAALKEALLQETSPDLWFDAKVWMSIDVRLPKAGIDAINFIEAIADAVKVAIGVDDRWFAISRMDWMIDKINPGIDIVVVQGAHEDFYYCSYCNNMLPVTNFYAKSPSQTGLGPCKECKKAQVKRQRQARLQRTA